MSKTLAIRLTGELSAWLAEISVRTGLSQSQIVRGQLEKARAAADEQPFMRLAGSLQGLPRNLSERKGYSRS